jgi:hypothetical protein
MLIEEIKTTQKMLLGKADDKEFTRLTVLQTGLSNLLALFQDEQQL